jgi:hypothetical protein
MSKNDTNRKYDYLMNTASFLFFMCYIPEFYANYKNKNANIYNLIEKIVLLGATGFALGYSLSIKNDALIVNYAPLFGLDTIALLMRFYYVYQNRNRDVAIRHHTQVMNIDIENPIQNIDL